MGRPYGKLRKKRAKAPKMQDGGGDAVLKIKLRGKDGAPLSMQEMRDGLYEIARKLQKFDGTHRAKWVTVYLTMVDENGIEVLSDPRGEWEIYPYQCAADEHGA